MNSVGFIKNNLHLDIRGELNSVEVYQETGIKYERYFLIQNIKGGIRGGHAQKNTHQVLQIIRGSLTLEFQYFNNKGSFKLNIKSKPIFLPKLTWVEMKSITEDSIILVFASDKYDIKNSIRDKNHYNRFIRSN